MPRRQWFLCIVILSVLMAGCIEMPNLGGDCQSDIKKAQTYADKQEVCGQLATEMRCPSDSSVTYLASDTCEAGKLEDLGWTRVIEENR